MIYQIDDKYYVNISPNIYVEVELHLQGDDLILAPTNKQREVYDMRGVKQISFEKEKDNLKRKLINERNKQITQEGTSQKSDRFFRPNKRK